MHVLDASYSQMFKRKLAEKCKSHLCFKAALQENKDSMMQTEFNSTLKKL